MTGAGAAPSRRPARSSVVAVAVVAQEDLLEVVVVAADRAHLVPRRCALTSGSAEPSKATTTCAPSMRRLADAGQAPAAPRPAARRRRTRSRAAGPRSPAGSRASRPRPAVRGAGSRPGRPPARPRTACATTGRPSGPAAATSASSAWKLCCTSGSRPAIGSSRISSSGSCMKAWIRPSFWRLPVESSRIGPVELRVEALGQLVAHAAGRRRRAARPR